MNTYLHGCASLLLLIALDVLPLCAQEKTAPRTATTTGPCSVKAEYKQFDFWVGEWDVTDKEKKVATSSIQKIVGGCIVFENYFQFDGYTGKSFNFFDAALKKWRQTWVDRSGNVSEFVGEYKEGAMRFEGESHRNDGSKVLAGLVVYFWGFRLLRFMLVPLALLILAIPIPAIIFNKIAFPLQLFASRCAVWAMRGFDIPVLRQGNIIEFLPFGASETKKLEVVEACSGIRSLMTLVTLAAIYAYFTYPKDDSDPHNDNHGALTGMLKQFGFWRSGILVISAVPIAIVTNGLRVSGTGVLAHYYGLQVADGFFHTFSGWIIYIAAFLLLLATGWLLGRFGVMIQSRPGLQTR